MAVTQKAISLPFSINEYGGIGFTSSEAKIWKDRVFLSVMTGLSERLMSPNYGSQLRELLFENYNEAATTVQSTVTYVFGTWLTSLQLLSVSTELDDETMQLSVTINYQLPNLQTDTLTLTTGTFNRAGELIEE
jgi:phage baseplate assembly protein W